MNDSSKPRRRKGRVEQIALDHDLPPYEPKVGDIVIAFHLFKDPAEIQRSVNSAESRGLSPEEYLASTREPLAKFRPCIVMAAREGRAILVPISSSPEPHGRHMALSEPDELRDAGLADHKPSYAKVLEAAQYDLPHPMILPIRGEDGKATWLAGKATTEMRRQTALEMKRQKDRGRLTSLKDRSVATLPSAVIQEMNRSIAESKSRRRRQGSRRPSVQSAPPTHTHPEALSSEMERRRAALEAHLRSERVRKAAQDMAHRKGAYPTQADPLKSKAEGLARRRGVHPDQRASQDPRDKGSPLLG